KQLLNKKGANLLLNFFLPWQLIKDISMIVDLLGFGGTGKTTVKNKILINVKSHSSAITEYERPNFGNIKSMLKWGLFVLSTPSTLIKAYKLLKFLKKQ